MFDGSYNDKDKYDGGKPPGPRVVRSLWNWEAVLKIKECREY